jgi:hypothetical protein
MTLKEVRDYMKGLELKVLKPEDNNLRIRYVFFPKEIIRLGLAGNYGSFYMNRIVDRPLYGYVTFNVPYLYNHAKTRYYNVDVKERFLTRVFMHEYRHYIQNRDIEELGKYIYYTQLETKLEKDADEYANTYILKGIELPLDNIKKQVQDFYKDIPNCIKIRKWTLVCMYSIRIR